jgi:hypothetical protein
MADFQDRPTHMLLTLHQRQHRVRDFLRRHLNIFALVEHAQLLRVVKSERRLDDAWRHTVHANAILPL